MSPPQMLQIRSINSCVRRKFGLYVYTTLLTIYNSYMYGDASSKSMRNLINACLWIVNQRTGGSKNIYVTQWNSSCCVFRNVFKTILVSLTQRCFYLEATCFGLDIDHHLGEKIRTIKRHVKNAIQNT
jgi:hypothetical protein